MGILTFSDSSVVRDIEVVGEIKQLYYLFYLLTTNQRTLYARVSDFNGLTHREFKKDKTNE